MAVRYRCCPAMYRHVDVRPLIRSSTPVYLTSLASCPNVSGYRPHPSLKLVFSHGVRRGDCFFRLSATPWSTGFLEGSMTGPHFAFCAFPAKQFHSANAIYRISSGSRFLPVSRFPASSHLITLSYYPLLPQSAFTCETLPQSTPSYLRPSLGVIFPSVPYLWVV